MRPIIATTLTLLLLTGCGAGAKPPVPQAVAAAQMQGLSRSEALTLQQALDPVAADRWQQDAAALEAKLPRGLDVRSPAQGGATFGSGPILDLRYKGRKALPEAFTVRLDGEDITPLLAPGALKDQWVAKADVAPGSHVLTLTPRDKDAQAATIPFTHAAGRELDRLVALADATVKRFEPSHMGWDWGEGLLIYSLLRLDAQLGTPRYRPFVVAYFDHWEQKGLPKIDWSDKCAPGLAALELFKLTGEARYKAMADRVAAYLKAAEPTPAGGLNHLGTWWASKIYPESMWVDSLMMYNLFAAQYGTLTQDQQLVDFAAEQPLHFARKLQSPATGLWKHAYYPFFKGTLPVDDTYWLRGNGWALASIPETLDVLGGARRAPGELKDRYSRLATGLLPYQDATGLWSTVLNRPGKTYLESSGTALMAWGMLKGVHGGYLPESFRAPARQAYQALLGRLEQKPEGPSMPEISHNTLPYTFLGYKLVPQRNDLAFGLAAMIMAGVEFEQETR